MCLRLKTSTSWEHYDCLHQQGVLSDDNHMYLNIILALSIYIRATSYFKEGCQTESIQVDPKINPNAATRYYVPINLFLFLGCLLIPVKQSIEFALRQIEKCSTSSVYQNNLTERVIKAVSVFQESLLPKIQVLYFTGQYKEAKDDLSKVVGKPIENASYSEFCQCIESLITKCSTLATPLASTSTTPTEGPSMLRKYSELSAYILYYTNNYDRAAEYFNQFLVVSSEQQGLWRLLIAHCHQEMGDMIAAKSFLDEAKVNFKSLSNPSDQSSTGILSLAFGPNCKHEDASTTFRNIGWLFQCLSDHKEALDNYLMALKLDVGLHGQICHSSIASDYNYIGMAYRDFGEYEKSLEYHTKSVAMQQAIYGVNTNHSSVAISYDHIGFVYWYLGEYKKSIEYYTKSLAMQQAIYGTNTSHSDIASSYNNIGLVYSDLGEYEKSLEYHTKSLAMKQAIYSANANHSGIAMSYTNIGSVYWHLGEYKKCLDYYTKSLAMQQAIYGENTNHSSIAISYCNIGWVYSELGEYEKSLEHHEKALVLYQAVYGTDAYHLHIANNYHGHAEAYQGMGEYSKALDYCSKSLTMYQQVFGAGANYIVIADCLSTFGEVCNIVGDYEKALKHHTMSLAMYQVVYGLDANHAEIAVCYKRFGDVYKRLGEYSKALDYFKKSQTMYKVIFGIDTTHPKVLELNAAIAIVEVTQE
ncbi:tetratricopeptide repeat protein 28-like [Watersipora subatra]|uniref:tetratricopeptide repeat protein 28-like n=1 Tax=Watersipora subatra TaxID=2589382 RepID=UPI00355B6B2C